MMYRVTMAPKSKIEPAVCPLCSFSSKKTTLVDRHVSESHGMSSKEAYDSVHGVTLCRCGCGQECAFLGIKKGYSEMLKGHNANIYSVYDKETAEGISRKRREKLVGQTSWAKGLTKDDDERIAKRGKATSLGRKRAFEEGRIKTWSKGLTSETDERVKSIAEKLKVGFETGEYVPWAKGLTKETDEAVAKMAMKVSITHKKKGIRDRLDASKRLTQETIRERIETGTMLELLEVGDYKNDASDSISVRCKECKNVFFSSLRKLQYGRCWNCDPNGSVAQIAISRFIEGLGVEVNKNHRGSIMGASRMAELDIFVPSRSLAVEYNGLYWHSELHKSSIYHQGKTDKCAELGIDLLHVFEDEWRDKQDIVKSVIVNRLKLNERKVAARKCKVVELSSKQKSVFFGSNHIDGNTSSTVAFGLTIDGEVVAGMSLRKPFHKKYKNCIEIARSCSKTGTTVVGGVGRLVKRSIKWANDNGYEKVFTYVDTRHGTGKSYEKAGMMLVGETPSRYWYTDCSKRFNRFKFRADKSRNMSQQEVAEESNVVKIWGCKNLIYEISV